MRKPGIYLRILLFAALTQSAGRLVAQTNFPNSSELPPSAIYRQLEQVNTEFLTEESVEDYLSRIEQDAARLIDPRTAGLSDILTIPTISLSEALLIQRSAGDAAGLRDLDGDRLRMLLPFLGNSLPSTTQITTRHRGIIDPSLSRDELYTSGSYSGSPWKIYDRLSIRDKELSLTFVQSKDAGEPKLLDHLAGNLQYSAIDKTALLRQVIVGDFLPQYGEGLLFSHGAIFSRSLVGVLDVSSASSRLYGYASSGEVHLRGGAARLQFGRATVDLFGSVMSADADIDSVGVIRVLPIDGYHRTDQELARKYQAKQSVFGGHLEYSFLNESDRFLKTELAAYGMRYDHAVDTRSQTAFKGAALQMASAAVHAGVCSVTLSSEVGASKQEALPGSVALTASASAALSESFELVVNYRHLPVDFVSPFGSTFGQATDDVQNESGIYFGVRYRFGALTIAGAVDGSQNFRILSSREYQRKLGDEYLAAEYKISPSLTLFSQVRVRAHSTADSSAPLSESITQSNYRFEAQWQPWDLWSFRARGELVTIAYPIDVGQSGWLGFLNARYKAGDWSAEARVERCQSESYASRLYAWEPSVPGYSAINPLYGKLTRIYLLASDDIFGAATLSAKASTSFFDVPRTSSNSVLPQTHDDRLELQLDLRF